MRVVVEQVAVMSESAHEEMLVSMVVSLGERLHDQHRVPLVDIVQDDVASQ